MQFFPTFFLLTYSAFALQPRLNVTELERLSDRIVIAIVSSSECRWAAGATGGIETIVWLSPQRHLKGEPTDSLSLLIEGGQLGYHQTWVEDEVQLGEDHRYLLFLRQNQAGYWRVLGGGQGAIELYSEHTPGAPHLDEIFADPELKP
jgi:hypothetical protein